LPLPDPIYVDGERLAASYMNFLVLNGAVLVPTYAQPQRDAQALAIIGECYPDREIVGFDCCDIVREGGAIHCMSQHQPAVG
jgi:agmatine deiminase